MKSNGASGWVEDEVPFNALYNRLGQLTSFTAVDAHGLSQLKQL